MTMLCYNVKRLQTPPVQSPEPGSEQRLQGEGKGGAKAVSDLALSADLFCQVRRPSANCGALLGCFPI